MAEDACAARAGALRLFDGGGHHVLNVAFGGVAGWVMDQEFYRQQAQCVRDLAERADPFTRKRLLNLADSYDAKGGRPLAPSRAIDLPLPGAVSATDGPAGH